MAPIFPPHDKVRLCEKNVLESISMYFSPVDKDDEKRISLMHVPTFYGNTLFRISDWTKIKFALPKDVPHKNMEIQLVGWGMSKFLTIGEYVDTIKTRQRGAANCNSREELQVYTCAVKDVIGEDIIDLKTKEAKLNVSKAQFEFISKTASTLGMHEYQFALYLMYIAVKYIQPEDYKNSDFQPKDWEQQSIDKMIIRVDNHIRTLWLDIDRYNKLQELRGNSLI